MNASEPIRTGTLYPPIEAYDRGYLDVGDGHTIYYEVCGNPAGKPALFLHGGPGGGFYADHRRLFDPARYRIVLFDQRGCGRSRPLGSLVANTTAHLVDDIERLRVALGVDRFIVLGGSWGATLALLYAQTHRDHVAALILRGVFTARRREILWLYGHGASQLFPEAWSRFVAPIPLDERGDLIAAYRRRLDDPDRQRALDMARFWCDWESELMTLAPRRNVSRSATEQTLALARIETHYFTNDTFLSEGQVLAQVSRLSGLPGIIVQGRYDVVTPATTAFELHQAWPGSQLEIVPDAGHATSEPGIVRKLVEATDAFA
jgi:proline iminopeptidase